MKLSLDLLLLSSEPCFTSIMLIDFVVVDFVTQTGRETRVFISQAISWRNFWQVLFYPDREKNKIK